MNKILLSFDLEEFDIPEEYGQIIPEKEKLEVSLTGLNVILTLLDKYNIKATFYTTAFFAERNKEIIKTISEKHEIASHGYYHSSFKPDDILGSKTALEQITGKPVHGFRMARLQPFDESLLAKSGYIYNSSLNPTFIPGRYNNFGKPRTPFISSGIVNLPVSVATALRIPLFWISFKRFPFNFYRSLALHTLIKYNYLHIYFHPWEFADISTYKLPSYLKAPNSSDLAAKLEKLLLCLKDNGEFILSETYCRQFTDNKK